MAGKGKKKLFIIGGIIGGIILIIILASVIPGIIDRLTGAEEEDTDDDNEVEENLPPVAVLTANKTRLQTGVAALFSGNGSYDPDPENMTNNGISTFQWNWGDGSQIETTNNATTYHVYTQVGTYNVTLTVFDFNESFANDTVQIKVVHATQELNSGPTVMIGEPILIGVVGNSTEMNWSVNRGAQLMTLEISIQGVWVRGTSASELDVLLYNPYEDLMENETVRVIGTRTLDWSFGAEEVDVVGSYYLYIQCYHGVSAVTISGLVSYT